MSVWKQAQQMYLLHNSTEYEVKCEKCNIILLALSQPCHWPYIWMLGFCIVMSPSTNPHFSQDWHDKLDPNSHSVTVQVTDRLFLEAKLQQNPAMSLVDLFPQNRLEVSPLVTTNYLKTRKASKAQGLHSFPELLILNWKQRNITLWPNCKDLWALKGIKTRTVLGLILSGLNLFYYSCA
jgi:hypothetical protein